MDRKIQNDIFKLLLNNKQSSSYPGSIDVDYLLSQSDSKSSSSFQNKGNATEMYAALLQAGSVITEVKNLQKENEKIKQQLEELKNTLQSTLSKVDENNQKTLTEVRKERESIEKSNGKISKEYNEISKPRKSFYETSKAVYGLIYSTYAFFAAGFLYINSSAIYKFLETKNLSNSFLDFLFMFLIEIIPGAIVAIVFWKFFTPKDIFHEDAQPEK